MRNPKRYPFSRPLDDVAKAERALRTDDSHIWEKRGEKAVLALFKSASKRVPAYKDFLKKNRIRPELIRTIADFKTLPLIDKNNYLRAYTPAALSWDGAFMNSYRTYASTSGSTGAPYYFPRERDETDKYALLAELYLRAQYKIQKQTTLYVNCFAMGAWIGGLFTYQAIERLAENGGYALHQITPGLAKEEALKAIRELGPRYEQIIIAGYPPFVKDLIDQGSAEGMNWKNHKIGFIFSAEGFNERFRDYMAEAVGQDNALLGSLNHYGTVDLGTMAYETPSAALLRRMAIQDTKFFGALFGQAHRLPTLAQYIPEHFYFESINSGLVCSTDAGFPLLRYDLKDQGGVRSFEEVLTLANTSKDGFTKKAKTAGINTSVFKLPFVYLYERADFSVTLYGANIYPEHIRQALEGVRCKKFATGKCTLRIVEARGHEPRLEVNIELKRGINPRADFKSISRNAIVETLLEHNSEFRSNYSHLPKKMLPRINIWPFGDSHYFSARGKQKWTEK